MFTHRQTYALVITGVLAWIGIHGAAPALARSLVSVAAPQHAPLFLDADTVQRRGSIVSFKYLLETAPAGEAQDSTDSGRSNEIEAALDCARRTFTVRRLVVYSGPRGSGSPIASRTFLAPGARPETIAPKSTFAYLEAHLCAPR